MTHDETILRLIATDGVASRSALVLDTGWGIPETNAVVDRLMAEGKVVAFPCYGNNRHHGAGKMLCLPETRAEALKKAREVRQ